MSEEKIVQITRMCDTPIEVAVTDVTTVSEVIKMAGYDDVTGIIYARDASGSKTVVSGSDLVNGYDSFVITPNIIGGA